MRLLSVPSLLLLLACGGCGATARAPQPANAADTLRQIHALAGTAPCTVTAQCRTLALGAKACGGPEAYLAWSTGATTQSALLALAQRYRAQREAQNAAEQLASDCRLVEDPGALCRVAPGATAGVCALRAPGAGAAE